MKKTWSEKLEDKKTFPKVLKLEEISGMRL